MERKSAANENMPSGENMRQQNADTGSSDMHTHPDAYYACFHYDIVCLYSHSMQLK